MPVVQKLGDNGKGAQEASTRAALGGLPLRGTGETEKWCEAEDGKPLRKQGANAMSTGRKKKAKAGTGLDKRPDTSPSMRKFFLSFWNKVFMMFSC